MQPKPRRKRAAGPLEADYVINGLGYLELSEKYTVPYNTVKSLARRGGWKGKRLARLDAAEGIAGEGIPKAPAADDPAAHPREGIRKAPAANDPAALPGKGIPQTPDAGASHPPGLASPDASFAPGQDDLPDTLPDTACVVGEACGAPCSVSFGKDAPAKASDATLSRLRAAASSLAAQVEGMLRDPKQFYRYVVPTKKPEDAPEVILDKADVKAMRETIGALKDLAAITRDLYALEGDGQHPAPSGVVVLGGEERETSGDSIP